jgi:predicted GNAT family acetyltransferase
MRQLTENDRAAVLEYVGVEPEVNIFFIGDVENFGVDCAEVSIWAFGQGAPWDSVVLRYTNDYVVYSRNAGYDAGQVASFLKTKDVGMISGKYEIVARLEAYFPERRLRSMFLTKCHAVKAGFDTPDGCEIRALTAGDAETLADLLTGVDEFSASYHDRETTVTKLRTSLGCGSTCCGAFVDGALVSCAQATAENSKSAMVVGVATRADVRGRGFASAVVSSLCRESFRKGKAFLCLFYDNPAAGRIYNRIGFEPFGKYALFEKDNIGE